MALGRYSHDALKRVVTTTGIEYQRLERGILHFFSSQADFEAGAAGAELMRRYGVDRRVLDRAEVLKVEPALTAFGLHIHGGSFTPSDESGDAQVFTQKLAALCRARGACLLFNTSVDGLDWDGSGITGVRVRCTKTGLARTLVADQYVAAMGSYTAPLLRPLGIYLNIYPAKGYSATLRLLRPQDASVVSLLDDSRKIAISRLGDKIRIAGTAELAGYDSSLAGATAQKRCAALVRRYEELFPGVADTREPNYWTGLRPSTPQQHPANRLQPAAQFVAQRRPRHAGLDPRRGLGPSPGRVDQRQAAGAELWLLRQRTAAVQARCRSKAAHHGAGLKPVMPRNSAGVPT